MTAARIIDETEQLLREMPFNDLTLNLVAERSGVSVQTVIRHHGGKDELLETTARQIGERVRAQRNDVTPGDWRGAIDNVLEHYESEADLVLRILSEEAQSSFAAEGAAAGREFHRKWVDTVFGPLIDDSDRERILDALVVATDIFTWRLLRRDLGRSLDETRDVLTRLVGNQIGETK